MINAPIFNDMIDSASRDIRARVELLDDSTLLNTFTYDGALQSFSVERTGNSNKFFGFGICQKLTLKLLDKERNINITKGQKLDIAMGVGSDYIYPLPAFYVEEVARDENTNNLSVTAYDAIYSANTYTVSDLTLPKGYSIYVFAAMCASKLGIPIHIDTTSKSLFDTYYSEGANFGGKETLREALDDVAEATGTIYFVNNNWELTFKTLDVFGNPVLTIDKSKYFTLSAKTPQVLNGIASVTELGDNVGTGGEKQQYLRDNAFLSLRDDVAALIQSIGVSVLSLSICQFNLKWRGNFLLELGDKISITNKDNSLISTYLLNDTITYNGGFIENSSWSMSDNQSKEYINPTSLGEMLKETYAKVDKANGQITLLVSGMDEVNKSVSNTVKQVDVEYYLSTSTSSATGGSWSTTAPQWESGKYMWSRQKVTYTNGSTITRNETCIAGAKGEDGSGKDGRGISDIVTEYYLSSNRYALVGGEWSETQPEWTKDKYIWTRTRIEYTNPTSTEYTTPICDASWAAINDIKGTVETHTQDISQLKIEKDNISASVSQITTKQDTLTKKNEENSKTIEELVKKTEATMSAEEINLAITTEISKGAEKVVTSKGFLFDNNGLTISDADSEISTNIDEDGMSILRGTEEVLTVDNFGVKARNLEATTYLTIGTNSRFEDYVDGSEDRTACFWLGTI